MRHTNTKTIRYMGFAIAAAVSLGGAAWGQNPRLQISQLDKLSSKAAEVVDVTLDEPMMKIASKFMAADDDPEDAEARELVKDLKGVYVKSFEFDKEGEYTPADLEAIRSQLSSSSWSKMVSVVSKRDAEISEVYMMNDPASKKVLGLAILVAEPKELTVVNIVGPIDMEKLSSLEGKMGIPKLGVEKGKKNSSGGRDEKK